MTRQKHLFGMGAAVIVAVSAILLGGCANPFASEPAKYSITYDGNANTAGIAPVDSAKYEAGSSVIVLANASLEKTGKSFQGWAQSNRATTPDYLPGATFSMPAKSLTLYAVWADTKTWTVTFDSNGGSAVISQTVTDGQKAVEPTQPTRASFAFGGWYTSPAFATKWDFGANTVTAAITLYAKWLPVTGYTVTYNGNGGTGEAPADTVQHQAGGIVTVAGQGTLSNGLKKFLGWSLTSSATTADYVTGATFAMPTKNLVLYAVWTDLQCWTVTFNAEGGSLVDSQTVPSGSQAKEPGQPTKEGYTLEGWYGSETYSVASKWYFYQNTVTGNTTLYAKWIPVVFTLRYDAGSNGMISGSYAQSVSYGSSGTQVTAVPNPGYKFVSWSDGLTTASRTDAAIKANLTVSAKFEKAQYTLSYSAEANGSITGAATQSVAYGESGTAVTAVANAGYHFLQWSDGKMDATRTDAQVSKSMTLSAAFAKDGTTNIVFTGMIDETIDLTISDDKTLSRANSDIMDISLTTSFDTYDWYLDGSGYKSSTAKTYTIRAAYETIGVHSITVIVTKNGVPYSKQLRYRVNY